jgi:hypothetical protein
LARNTGAVLYLLFFIIDVIKKKKLLADVTARTLTNIY